MASQSDLTIRLRLLRDKAVAGLRDTKEQIKGIGGAGTRAGLEASRGFQRADTAASRLGDKAKLARAAAVGALSVGAALGTAKAFLTTADAVTELRGQLRQVTDSEEELIERQEQLFRVAQDTRGEFKATAQLYTRLRRNTDEKVASDEKLLGTTDLINKALKASAADGQSAAAALTQLNQGLASGALRGEEFNSVAEQTPRLAKAIADGLGLTIGELREFAKNGKLTTKVVIDAINSQRESIERDFAASEQTIADSGVKIGNALTRLVGKLDETTGASGGVAHALDNIGRSITMLGDLLEDSESPPVKMARQLGELEQAALDAAREYQNTVRVAIRSGEDLANLATDTRNEYRKQLGQTRSALQAEIELAEVRERQGHDQTALLALLRSQLADVTTETQRLNEAEKQLGVGETGVAKLVADFEKASKKLNKLSDEDLGALAQQAQQAVAGTATQMAILDGEFSKLEPRFAEMARQSSDAFQALQSEAAKAGGVVEALRVEQLRRLGIDAEQVKTGLSSVFRGLKSGFENLIGPLGATGDAVTATFEKIAAQITTVEELESAEKLLADARKSGAISADAAKQAEAELLAARADLEISTTNLTQREIDLAAAYDKRVAAERSAANQSRSTQKSNTATKQTTDDLAKSVEGVGDKAEDTAKRTTSASATLQAAIAAARSQYEALGTEATRTFDKIIERSFTYGQSVSTAIRLANQELRFMQAELGRQAQRAEDQAANAKRLADLERRKGDTSGGGRGGVGPAERTTPRSAPAPQETTQTGQTIRVALSLPGGREAGAVFDSQSDLDGLLGALEAAGATVTGGG